MASGGGGLPDQADGEEGLGHRVQDQDGEEVEEVSPALFHSNRFHSTHLETTETKFCSGFFVAVSWSSFLLPSDDIASRSGLLITTLLVLINMFNSVLEVIIIIFITIILTITLLVLVNKLNSEKNEHLHILIMVLSGNPIRRDRPDSFSNLDPFLPHFCPRRPPLLHYDAGHQVMSFVGY